MSSKANQILKETEGLNGPERLDGLTEALRIWPELEGARPLYDKAFAAEPTLDVAVSDVAAPLGPWVRSPADAADHTAALPPDPGQRRRRRP